MPLEITPTIAIPDEELVERFVRASSPGGQHVNKTSTAVELRFYMHASPSLLDEVKARLKKIAGSWLTLDGVLVLFAQGAHSQEMNRQEARARLAELVRRATEKPKPRRPTKPTYSSKLKRLEAKSQRSSIKSGRGRVRRDEG